MRLSCSGLGQGTTYLNSVIMVHPNNLAPKLSACDHVCLLGVIISADLSLDCHVSVISSTSFYLLRQHDKFTTHSAMNCSRTVHAFVTSRANYCNLLLAGAPKSVTDNLQWVMNDAARAVSGTKKYDRGLTHLLHSELHCLDVAD